ncbi:GAF domain-containing sensor histidine kinase [Xanthomonas vesicatoria]|uniref:GAF domain-containing sensor histidine kinase n=1 Tax=Xanthomonas vesicatoria TaxID=56460 RepID=UPI0007323272|nr:GAF domain-containing sensor histidine kinase [Xanthomonas vesicatoria]KTF34113.1 histidine kinase [Xanthomonas vesicatoria]MCC8556606.1 GAF domain-containing sensor histidine kinase [Xanthomonas vesicatoria]MCC8603306.1 GAF domain-containing sensor histidine kinase [Xanthomonas vesicatoria]MCC8610360.1 GAF domain-containing sensor histidine kinase [Xanthomonas vesicatoria]MCC8675744.1 GAF domain-containing sensor histidine kinase [Xanthomonas vesicatoria]
MNPLPPELRADIARVGRLSSVPDVLNILTRLTGMGFAAVARVTEARWITCQVRDELSFGLGPGDELPLATTFCDSVRVKGNAVWFGHASDDPAYRDHPSPRLYGFESYVSVPIRFDDGSVFGTLCALDPLPRVMDQQLVEKVELLAQLLAAQIQAEQRAEESAQESRRARSELGRAGASARLREEFIGILGHDLRNPLQSMHAVVDVLAIDPLNQRQGGAIRSLQRSLQRMEELIDFACDFARGIERDWLQLDYGNGSDLLDALSQVVDETRAAYPNQVLSTHVAIDEPVHGDAVRLAQMFGSMMINAVVQGQQSSLIKAVAVTERGRLRIEVCNLDGIDPRRLDVLHASTHVHTAGRPLPEVDLGLHMAAQIAQAHQGELHITSGKNGTCFRVELACARPRARMHLVNSASSA